MSQFSAIGNIQYPNQDGYLINQLRLSELQPQWNAALNECVDYIAKLYERKLHSIYVRGSVARGEAIEGVSDLDIVVIWQQAFGQSPESITSDNAPRMELSNLVRDGYPFIAGVDVEFYPVDEILSLDDYCPIRILLAIQSICVYGSNLIPKLPLLKPGPECFIVIPTIKNKIAALRIEMEQSNFDVSVKSKWIAKQLVRLGFELCMQKANYYTRDLYPSLNAFINYYPEQEKGMRNLAEVVLLPTSDKKVVEDLMDNFGEWLIQEAARLYPHYTNDIIT